MLAPQYELHRVQDLFTAIEELPISSSNLGDLDVQVSVLDLENDHSSHICTPWPRERFAEACARTLDKKTANIPDHEDDSPDEDFNCLRSRYHMALYSNDFLGHCFTRLKLLEAATKLCLWWKSE